MNLKTFVNLVKEKEVKEKEDPFMAYKIGIKDGLQMALDICKVAAGFDVEFLIRKQLEMMEDK